MFISKTCSLFTVLTILPKSITNVPTALHKKFDSFIVGGKYANIEDFPHSAFLAITCRKRFLESFTCGSSILNQRILLTAAHCVDECRAGTTILVSVGSARKTEGTFYSGRAFVVHEHYDGENIKNDIGLVLLDKPLKFGRKVKRILLSKVGIYDEPALLAGWGVTNEEAGTDSIFLKSARQVAMTRQKCLYMLPNLNQGVLCANGDKSHKREYGYAAVGDSGSALVVRGYIQIGIVSYKVPETTNTLIVYTDTSQYYNWITSTARILFCRS